MTSTAPASSDSIFTQAFCKIIEVSKSLGGVITGVGSKTASATNPAIIGASAYLQNLQFIDKLKILFAVIIVLIIVFLLAFKP